MSARWRPRVTVAGIVCHAGRYLLVEERPHGQACLNQPAGHWEPGETLLEAVCREVREETGWPFRPQALVGLYRWDAPSGDTFLRLAVAGTVDLEAPRGPLDAPILATHWLTPAQLERPPAPLRSPLVRRCIQDHARGRAYPLELLVDLGAGLTPDP